MDLFLSAGDPSGDNASARLIEELKRLDPQLSLFGLGGEKLRSAGQEQFVDGIRLAVLGFWEVARQYRFFRSLMHRTIDEIEKRRPDCILLVDYPGFNLRLARRIKKLGIPIIYYISPQVWAWGKGRLKQISELVDLMLVLLPFEKPFYDQSDIKCEFVGHYLLEDIPGHFIGSKTPTDGPLVLLPGSRAQEVERMLPSMLQAAAKFNIEHETTAKVAGISGLIDYDSYLQSYQNANITITYDKPRELIAESSLVLTASGTATLEAGIIGRPMVIVYKTGFLTYQIAKRLVKLDMIGLVNLVLSKKVLPELIQSEANPNNMVDALEKLHTDQEHRSRTISELKQLSGCLGGKGASARAAKLIADSMKAPIRKS